MKHRIKPVGILKAVSLYADGTAMHLYVTEGVDWTSKKCNQALDRIAKNKMLIAKGTYKIPKAPYLSTGRS